MREGGEGLVAGLFCEEQEKEPALFLLCFFPIIWYNFCILCQEGSAMSDRGFIQFQNVKKVYQSIPETYDEKAVLKWKQDVLEATTLMQR